MLSSRIIKHENPKRKSEVRVMQRLFINKPLKLSEDTIKVNFFKYVSQACHISFIYFCYLSLLY